MKLDSGPDGGREAGGQSAYSAGAYPACEAYTAEGADPGASAAGYPGEEVVSGARRAPFDLLRGRVEASHNRQSLSLAGAVCRFGLGETKR